jgi:histidyl-tRNA synthetase
MIANFQDQGRADYLRLASELRAQGLNVELFPEAKKMGVQFKYADRRGILAVVVAGPDELQAGQVKVKWLPDGSQTEVAVDSGLDALARFLKEKLQS